MAAEGLIQTPQYLFNYGMCLCETCGKLHSVDYAYCNDCCQQIMIVILPGEKPDDARILNFKKK